MPEQPTATDPSVQNIPVPPSPQAVKSSNEILCELFGAFNATPPPLDEITPQDSQGAVSEKSHKRHKKHSKKKHKKVKKKRRSSSSDSRSSNESKKRPSKKYQKTSSKPTVSDSESVDSKNKKRGKLGKFSASDSYSEEDEPRKKKKKPNVEEKSSKHKCDKVKIKQEKDSNGSQAKYSEQNISAVPSSTQDNVLQQTVSAIVDDVIDSKNSLSETLRPKIIASDTEDINNSDFDSFQLTNPIKQEPKSDVCSNNSHQDINDHEYSSKGNGENLHLVVNPLPVADVFAEDLIDCGIKKDELKAKSDKSKPTAGKITIQNLKFSQVYEATVKQIEEEAKLKAEKYEEGELSDSSAELERSPSPSSSGSVEEVSIEQDKPLVQEEEKRHRHHHKKEKRHRHDKSRDRKRSTSKEKHQSHSRHRHRERTRGRSRERARDRTKEMDRSKERPKVRERSRERTKDRERSKERTKDRDRSKDRAKDRDRSKERTRSRERKKSKERTRSRERTEKHRHARSSRPHSRERVKRNSEEKIDKQKLLEIARKNALNMMKNPSGAPEQTKVAITSGGKTVNELTDFCKLLSKKDADGHESISSNTSHSSDSESEKPFHHPFQIKDRPSSIVLNIRQY